MEAIDRCGKAWKPLSSGRQALRVLGGLPASRASGRPARPRSACSPAEVPDEASCDILARRIAIGGKEARRPRTCPSTTGSSKGRRLRWPWRDELHLRVVAAGRRCFAHEVRARRVGAEARQAGRAPRGLPRGRVREQEASKRANPPEALRAATGQELRRLRVGADRGPTASEDDLLARSRTVARTSCSWATSARARRAHGGGSARSPPAGTALSRFFGLLARDAPAAAPRRRKARPRARPARRAEAPVIDELGFLRSTPTGRGCSSRWSPRPLRDAVGRVHDQPRVLQVGLRLQRRPDGRGRDRPRRAPGRLLQFRGESYRVRHALMR